jgi:hypothetical protein
MLMGVTGTDRIINSGKERGKATLRLSEGSQGVETKAAAQCARGWKLFARGRDMSNCTHSRE